MASICHEVFLDKRLSSFDIFRSEALIYRAFGSLAEYTRATINSPVITLPNNGALVDIPILLSAEITNVSLFWLFLF